MHTRITANAQAMRSWLSKAEESLANHSDRLNAINIFPVADGDTGTNLYLTVKAASHAANEIDTQDIGELLGAAGRAAMEAAQGNSGTLFSVFLTAMSEPLQGASRLSGPLLAIGLQRAQIRSWSVLSDPVPGTMLSVLEESARAAATVDAAQHGDDSNNGLAVTLRAAVDAALDAVVQTESQLGTLTAARVVDAGGVGFLLILDALRAASLHEERQEDLLDGLHGYGLQDPHIHDGMPDDDGMEVMCTINLSPLDAATLRMKLDEIGDSVIMSAVQAIDEFTHRWRIHAHVPEAGPALELVRAAGDPSNVSVTALSAATSVDSAAVDSAAVDSAPMDSAASTAYGR